MFKRKNQLSQLQEQLADCQETLHAQWAAIDSLCSLLIAQRPTQVGTMEQGIENLLTYQSPKGVSQ